MMNCVIIDDEPHAIDVLKRYVEQTDMVSLKNTFRNPVEALKYVNDEKIDLVFLDINMPGLSGVQFLQALRRKPMVIFTTAYSSYAVESYDLEAVDYLLKPILFERFLKAVARARDLMKTDDTEFILLKSGTQVHQVRVSEILFITKESNYLEVNTIDKKILVRGSMNEVFSIFPESHFLRIHKSHVVALAHVQVASADHVEVNKIKLPLAASYREELIRRLKGKFNPS
jgi:two-component system, LytTR family, response regulator